MPEMLRTVRLNDRKLTVDPNSSEPSMLTVVAAAATGVVLNLLLQAGFDFSPAVDTAIGTILLAATVAIAGWVTRQKVFSGKTVAEILDATGNNPQQPGQWGETR